MVTGKEGRWTWSWKVPGRMDRGMFHISTFSQWDIDVEGAGNRELMIIFAGAGEDLQPRADL